MNNSRMSLDDFKLTVDQDNEKIQELMGGKDVALAGCHPTRTRDCLTGPSGNSDPDSCN